MTKLEWALTYASLGWATFPLNKNKRPLAKCDSCKVAQCHPNQCGHKTCHGHLGAATDESTLREWFSDDQYNIGLAVPDGLFVIDIDPRNDGDKTLELIRHLLPKMTLVAESGRRDGGKHLWFRGALPPMNLLGIDIKRGGSGYVIVEPSTHPATGLMYRWVNWGTAIADIPAGFADGIPEAARDTRTKLQDVLGISMGQRELFEAVINGQTIYDGVQHNTLRDLAAHIASVYGEDRGWALYQLCVTRCEVPHPEDDVERSWESAVAKYDTGDWEPSEDESEAPEDTSERSEQFKRDVKRTLHDLAVKEEARRIHRQQSSSWERVDIDDLEDMLEDKEEEEPHRIADLWPENGTVVFAAEAKAGKTVTVMNLAKSLADGVPFLGRYETRSPDRNVVILNVEVSKRKITKWLRGMKIENRSKIKVVSLRGKTAWFQIVDPYIREKVANQLREKKCQVLIVDPVGPLWDAEGIEENENTPVGQWLSAVTEMAEKAGVTEIMIVHHFGHSAGRARGASKLLGWPDALWALFREEEKDSPRSDVEDQLGVDDGAARFFQARGRDVDVPKTLLRYNPQSRYLDIDPEGISGRTAKKKAATLDKNAEEVLSHVRENEGQNTTQIAAGMKWDRARVRDLLGRLKAQGRVSEEKGTGTSKVWFIVS